MNLAYDALYAARATGAPRPGEPGHDELRAEVEAWIKGARTVAQLAENDLKAGDMEAAMLLMRTSEKAMAARERRIERLVGKMPLRVILVATTLKWAPAIAIGLTIMVALLDLYDVGEWHHVYWGLPAIAAVIRPAMARLTGMA